MSNSIDQSLQRDLETVRGIIRDLGAGVWGGYEGEYIQITEALSRIEAALVESNKREWEYHELWHSETDRAEAAEERAARLDEALRGLFDYLEPWQFEKLKGTGQYAD